MGGRVPVAELFTGSFGRQMEGGGVVSVVVEGGGTESHVGSEGPTQPVDCGVSPIRPGLREEDREGGAGDSIGGVLRTNVADQDGRQGHDLGFVTGFGMGLVEQPRPHQHDGEAALVAGGATEFSFEVVLEGGAVPKAGGRVEAELTLLSSRRHACRRPGGAIHDHVEAGARLGLLDGREVPGQVPPEGLAQAHELTDGDVDGAGGGGKALHHRRERRVRTPPEWLWSLQGLADGDDDGAGIDGPGVGREQRIPPTELFPLLHHGVGLGTDEVDDDELFLRASDRVESESRQDGGEITLLDPWDPCGLATIVDGGVNDHAGLRAGRANVGQEIEPVTIGELPVEHDARHPGVEVLTGSAKGIGLDDQNSLQFEAHPNQSARRLAVVDDHHDRRFEYHGQYVPAARSSDTPGNPYGRDSYVETRKSIVVERDDSDTTAARTSGPTYHA